MGNTRRHRARFRRHGSRVGTHRPSETDEKGLSVFLLGLGRFDDAPLPNANLRGIDPSPFRNHLLDESLIFESLLNEASNISPDDNPRADWRRLSKSEDWDLPR